MHYKHAMVGTQCVIEAGVSYAPYFYTWLSSLQAL